MGHFKDKVAIVTGGASGIGRALCFLPVYPEIVNQVLMVPEIIGEVAIAVWLAFRGGKGATDR